MRKVGGYVSAGWIRVEVVDRLSSKKGRRLTATVEAIEGNRDEEDRAERARAEYMVKEKRER